MTARDRRRTAGQALCTKTTLIGFVIALFAVLMTQPQTALAAGNGYWSVYPGQLNNQQPRAFFNYVLDPGSSLTDSVIVTNQTTSSVKFLLYPADAFNASGGGGFSLLSDDKPMHWIGKWVSLSDQVFTVPAKTSAVETFQLTIPKGVPPGDYAGGIVARPYLPSVQKHGNINVGVYQAVASRIYVRVAGPLHPSVTITRLQVHPHTTLLSLFGAPFPADVTYTFTNTGNTVINPTTLLKISPLLVGTRETIGPKSFDSLLPGNSVTLTYRLQSVWTLFKLNADLGVTSKPSDNAGAATPPVTATAAGWNIPWLLILLIVVLIGYLLWRRRRRHQQQPKGSEITSDSVSPTVPSGLTGKNT